MTIAGDVEASKASSEALIGNIRSTRGRTKVVEALRELVRRPGVDTLPLFREVLDDPTHDVAAKRLALVELGKARVPAHQELLARNLAAREARVFSAAARSLGQIADEKGLEQLELAKAPDSPVARESLEFARVLAAHRLRLERHPLAVPAADQLVSVAQGRVFQTSRPRAELAGRVVRDVARDLPALALAEATAVALTCPESELFLVLARDFTGAEAIGSLAKRSALPLVMVKKGYSDRHYLDAYFFTQPGRGGIALLGTRPGGKLTYVGGVELERGALRFHLRSTATRYAPALDVEGRFDAAHGAFTFTRTLATATVAAPQDHGTPRLAPRPL